MNLSKVPVVSEEVSERLFIVIQVGRGHKETFDDDPRLLPVVCVRAARLEGVQGLVDGLLRRQADSGLTVLEVNKDRWPARLTLIVVQLKQILQHLILCCCSQATPNNTIQYKTMQYNIYTKQCRTIQHKPK